MVDGDFEESPKFKVIKIEDLAKIIGRTVQTIRVDVTRRPETLPPRWRPPGTNAVLWRLSDVIEWMDEISRKGQMQSQLRARSRKSRKGRFD